MATAHPGLFRGTVQSDTRPGGKLMIKVPAATGVSAVSAISFRVLMGFDLTTQQVTWWEYGLPPGQGVWVMFEQGDLTKPVVVGLM